ncbi:Rgg family transcriptional regulator [Enterococcus gallinarum]|uniref:Rgg family transcriptional regulator n=1 Tax=Enterococcus gallinarum TaxID=1353 RepID=UPI0027E16C1B|nr:hypothetical protein [Enterococcus gallinarum]MDQ6112993.1 hypothetical protein [Enterococcus gallinarum]
MYENIGSCFSTLRKSKHIPISNIVGTNISHSQYHRFVNNESDVSFTKFLFMLDQINITFEEFILLASNNPDPLKHGMLSIKQAFEKKDLSLLKSLSVDLKNDYKKNNQIKFLHLSYVCDSLINKIERSTVIPEGFSALKKYLTNTETWGHYELVLFNNTFFLFDEDTVYNFYKLARKTSVRYKQSFNHIKEVIMLNSNVILFFLERNRVDLALEVIESFSKIQLNNEQMYEKSIIKYWQIVKVYLSGDKVRAVEEMSLLQQLFCLIDSKAYGLLLQEIFEFIQNKY